MTRIRWTLLALFLGITLPAILIVQRAISSLDLEDAVRHEAVAERVFDEMERSLSDWLLREEGRPPRDYHSLADADADGVEWDPFAGTEEPFIVGWFAIDGDGATRFRAGTALAGSGAERLRRAIEEALRSPSPPESRPRLAASAAAKARDVATVDVPTLERAIPDRPRGATGAQDAQPEASAYDVLQSLNRAQALRGERQSKALRQKRSLRSDELERAQANAEADEDTEQQADRGWARSADASIAESARSRAPFSSPSLPPTTPTTPTTPTSASPSAGSAPTPTPRTDRALAMTLSSIDPLIGRTTGNGDIVLVRSVWQQGRVEREGLVLDRRALAEWLETSVLEAAGLSDRARIEFAASFEEAVPGEPYRYLHRFAEPFDALFARLELAPLPSLGSAYPIYALALLLMLVATLGLWAVERMTRVVVDFAQRRSDFVAAVSHELKTPLTAIRMYSEMLRDGLVVDEQKRAEYYGTITDESERLSRLIDNVLEFSRLEQDRRELRLVVDGLDTAVREAARKLRTHVESAGFELRLELQEDLPAVVYDRDAVTQLIFNLVDNALKYARHADRREIEIRLRESDGRIELRVRDFGPGVPENQLHRVFEPFYRIGEELTRTTDGTGIGLALVRELAEGMGAEVRGSNAAGGGFEVCIAFSPSR